MSEHLTNKKWWEAASVRAIRTMAQVAVATIGTSEVLGEIDWLYISSVIIVSGIVSILTSLGGIPEVDCKK